MSNLQKIRFLPYLLYFFIFLVVIFFRNQLDKDSIFITSDGQIKYYESVQFHQDFLNFECLYPAKNIDNNFQYFIFDYPWAYFNILKKKCIFQYPPLFSYIGSLFLYISDQAPLYYPLILFFINLILFHKILISIGLSFIWSFFTCIIGMILSFPFLSILDYSEMTLYHLVVLASLFIFQKLIKEKNLYRSKKYSFIWSFLIFFAFYIRMEGILLGLSFFLAMLIFYDRRKIFSLIPFFILGGLFCLVLFSLYYWFLLGYFLDVRAFTIIEYAGNVAFDLNEKLYIFQSFLYKVREKKGLFYAFPLFYFCVIFLFLKKKELLDFSKISFVGGVLYILIASWTSHDIGGVQNFGLRYLDAGFFAFVIGASSILNQLVQKIKVNYRFALFFCILALLYPTFQFTKTGLKTLRNGSFYYLKMQSYLKSFKGDYVIHLNLSTVYLVGYSYLEKKHIFPKGQQELDNLLKKLEKAGVNEFVILRNSYIEKPTQSIPKWQYERFLYNPKVSDSSIYKKIKEIELLSYRLEFYKK